MSISSEPWFPGFVTGSLALVGVIIAGLLQTHRERRKDKDSSRTPAPPTTQQVWERLDHQEKVLRAAVGIIGEVAEQWSEPHPPRLSRRYVDLLAEEGYLPPDWGPFTTE